MATMAAVPVQFGESFPGFLSVPSTPRAAAAPRTADQLVLEYQPMVRAVARKLHRTLPQHVELEDLVSAGMLGLIDAATKYQSDRDTQFRTYAQFRVRGAILDSLRELDWGSRTQRRMSREIEGTIGRLAQVLGRAPEEAEIAQALQMTVAELRTSLGELRGLELGSLHATRGEDSDEQEIDYLADASEPGALVHCMQGEMRQHLADAIDALPERERLVVTLYFYEELTLKEIAQVIGCVESRVSQMKTSAVLKLRAALATMR